MTADDGQAPFAEIYPVADAVLYEGYVLYPYRSSSLKNRMRWTFGGVYPRAYGHAQTGADRSEVGVECLLRGANAELVIEARFLELSERNVSPESNAAQPHSVRRHFGTISKLLATRSEHAFRRGQLHATLSVSLSALENGLFRLTADLCNDSNSPAIERAAALPDSLVAAHLLLWLRAGEFISSLDPPAEFARAARACVQRGLWPVLAGKKGRTDLVMASPIILYDYPEIAPESRADSYDATEIDEILLLRVLTLSDAEKIELRRGDPRACAILTRAEALSGEEILRLHGRLRKPSHQLEAIAIGERVRLRPTARADIFDLALAGRIATVRAVERDFEDRVQVSVTVDDDPGVDLGIAGWPGHRFYFFTDEVERLELGGTP